MSKGTVYLILTAGVIIGSYIPTLFGAGAFSFWGSVGGLIGAVIAGYLAYRMNA